MNIFSMMKQLKSLQEGMKKFKEDLERETVEFENEHCRIVSNLVGEIVEFKIKSSDCENLERHLFEALKEVNKRVKEEVKEKAENSLFGGMGLF